MLLKLPDKEADFFLFVCNFRFVVGQSCLWATESHARRLWQCRIARFSRLMPPFLSLMVWCSAANCTGSWTPFAKPATAWLITSAKPVILSAHLMLASGIPAAFRLKKFKSPIILQDLIASDLPTTQDSKFSSSVPDISTSTCGFPPCIEFNVRKRC